MSGQEPPGCPTAVCLFQSSGASLVWSSSKHRLCPILKVLRFNLLFSRPKMTILSSSLAFRMNRIHPEVSGSPEYLRLIDKQLPVGLEGDSEFLHRMNFTMDLASCSFEEGMKTFCNTMCRD